MKKRCTKCDLVKEYAEFNKNKNTYDGYSCSCRSCKRLYRNDNKEKHLLRSAKRRAKEKNIPFSIKEEDIEIPEICPVLDIPIFSGDGVMIDNSPNLDRIIPEKGYIPGNVRVISQKANRIKSNATVEEIRKVLKDLQKQEILMESRK